MDIDNYGTRTLSGTMTKPSPAQREKALSLSHLSGMSEY